MTNLLESSDVSPAFDRLVVALLRDVPSHVAARALDSAGPRDRLVVVAPASDPAWQLARRGAVFHPAVTVVQINWVLKMSGNPDLLIDAWHGSADEHEGIWDRAFLHLRDGARYVVERDAFPDAEHFALFGDRVTERRRSARSGVEQPARLTAFSRACGRLVLDDERVEVTKVGRDLLKLREVEASRAIAARSRVGNAFELVRRPALEFAGRGRTTFHPHDAPVAPFDETFSVPERRVRAYTGDVSVIGSCLALKESAVLPESFRHQMEKGLRNPRLQVVDPEFSRMNDRDLPATFLAGSYFHLDASNSGHFGHLTTEVLSKFWGWDDAVAHDSDVKAIFRIRHPNERVPRLERQLMNAYGIRDDQIQVVSEPVRVGQLIGATPQWHNQFPHYVDPAIQDTWDRMAMRLVDSDAIPVDRLFVSRREGMANRRCLNTLEVETFFADRGFTVVYPEELSLQDQATLFAHARVVAGFGGSALFNSMYARRLERMIVLTHWAYTARNEHMYGAVLGCDVDYFWSRPSVEHPEGGWSEEAYFSDWTFDFAALRGDLERVVSAS